MDPFTGNKSTIPVKDAVKERFDRIETRMKLLKELEVYLQATKPFNKAPRIEK